MAQRCLSTLTTMTLQFPIPSMVAMSLPLSVSRFDQVISVILSVHAVTRMSGLL
jgi:hypothetical protein